MPVKKINRLFSKLRNRHFFISDIIFLSITPYLSLIVRYDWNFTHVNINKSLLLVTFIFLTVKLAIFKFFGLYRRYWKNASIDDLALLTLLGVISGLVQIFIYGLLKGFEVLNFQEYPFSFPFLDAIMTFTFISMPRFGVRLFERAEQRLNNHTKKEIRTLIIGAGDAGVSTLIELQRNRELNLLPIGFIDDDLSKMGLRIRGISILGNRAMIEKIVERYQVQRILIAMPSVHGEKIREILKLAQKTKVEVFTLPGLSEIIGGKISIQKFRKIEIDDLLRREPIKTDLETIYQLLTGKIVLITGAGGSIGREICRQVSQANPRMLLLLGHGENSIFEIEQELKYSFTHLNNRIVPLIADVRNTSRIDMLISTHKPDIIFHTAAHKHVPMMETNLAEAVTNNIFGLKNVLDSAIKYNIDSLVYISTDKAVDPPNIMGATKRVAELLIQNRYKESKTKLITVRFGNVLGSRGSVVHTFREQIVNSGPITVTDPMIERFFMTIPEAVQLVLQAFKLGNGGEVFVLDMGKRIKIVDLAKDMIRLSGLDENEIEIKFTGLRKGEKMTEELFYDSEKAEKTLHTKIFNAKADYSNVLDCTNKVDELINLALEGRETETRELLFSIAHCKKE